MKQLVFNAGDISGGAATSLVACQVEWQGGDGWLAVSNFSQVSGTPNLLTGGSHLSGGNLLAPITTAGVYAFSAPRESLLSFQITALTGERVTFNDIYLLGNA